MKAMVLVLMLVLLRLLILAFHRWNFCSLQCSFLHCLLNVSISYTSSMKAAFFLASAGEVQAGRFWRIVLSGRQHG